MKNAVYALVAASVVTALLGAGCASPDAPQDGQKSLPKRAEDRATDIEVDSNINQINQALSMIKMDGPPPATLEEAKKAAKVPEEMWTDGVSGKPLVYDAASGTVHRDGAAPNSPPAAGSPGAPGGINVPGGGGF